MPVEISSTDDGTVALARCYGNLSEADIRTSLDFAFTEHRIDPGQDRIVTIDIDAQLHALDPPTLKMIQQRVLQAETRDGRAAKFRSVLVYASPQQEKIMSLYKAIWNGMKYPNVEFFVVDSRDEALEILASKRKSDSAG
jgi:hypothetical protein